MLQEQKDIHMVSVTLSAFNSMLRELHLLSLQDESLDCIIAFQSWLLSVLIDTSDKYSSTIKQETFGALLMLGLATGSLSTLLSALELSEHIGMKSCSKELFVVPMLKKLDSFQIDLKISVLSIDNLSGSWTLVGTPTIINNNSGSTNNNNNASNNNNSNNSLLHLGTIATDGEFLYIHDSGQLLKIGTGFFSEYEEISTNRGSIEKKLANWDPQTSGWLACVDRKLYYRSPFIEPASLVVFDCKTLKVMQAC